MDNNSSRTLHQPVDLPVASGAESHLRIDRLLAKAAESARLVASQGDRASLTLLHHHLHSLTRMADQLGLERFAKMVGTVEEQVMEFLKRTTSPEDGELSGLGRTIDRLISEKSAPRGISAQSATRRKPASAVQTETFNPRLIFAVVDDEPRRNQLTEQLRLYGYQAQSFSGLDVLAAAFDHALPDALVVDLDAPEGDLTSIAELARLQRRHARPCPVIFVASADNLLVRAAAVTIGARAFFQKPVQIDRLVDKLDVLTVRPEEEPYRVLIVDDDRSSALLNAKILTSAGMLVETVDQPLDLLQALVRARPELVLMDLYMPLFTGAELAAVMRQHEDYSGIPVVYLSGETDESRQLAAIRQGGDDFLTKPVQPNHLISAVLHLARRYRSQWDRDNRDGVTGLLNHSALRLALREHLHQDHMPLTLALLNIARFSRVNKRYGEKTGDRVLRRVAHLLRQRLGERSLLGRYGGNTFAIGFPGMDGRVARSLVEMAQRSLRGIRHEHGGETFSVTFRAGLASSPPASGLDELANSACTELERARRTGPDDIFSGDQA
jgi:diguanylate cyclase (GGDEF)-like protein